MAAGPLPLGPLPVLRVLRAELTRITRQTFPAAAVVTAVAQQAALQLLDVCRRPNACEPSGRPPWSTVGVVNMSPRLHLRLDWKSCWQPSKDRAAIILRLCSLHCVTVGKGDGTAVRPGVDLESRCRRTVVSETAHHFALAPKGGRGKHRSSAVGVCCVRAAGDARQRADSADGAVAVQVRGIQLPGLTRLQRLRVGGLLTWIEEGAGPESFPAPLTNLTQLDLASFCAAALRGFSACAAYMPHLRAGQMQGHPEEVCAAWFEGRGIYRAGGGTNLRLCKKWWRSRREAVWQVWIGCGACVSEGCTAVDMGDGDSSS